MPVDESVHPIDTHGREVTVDPTSSGTPTVKTTAPGTR